MGNHNDAGRQTAVIDALNQRTETTYDAAGQRTSSTDALGRTTKYVYDLAGRLTETIHPDSTPATDADNPRTRVQYDAAGRKVAETDAENRTVAYGHDATGRLTQVTDALGKITSYGYDEAGNQISQTDARGRVTRWAYDRMGRQTSRTLPMGQQEQMSYNAGGELVSHIDFMGRTTLHQYDLRGRRILTTHGDGRITQASYDAAGRRTSLSEGGNSWSWQYDARDRVTQLTQPAGVVSYQYDLAGNRTRTTSANQVVSYGFDALNRLRMVRIGTPANPPTASTPAHEYEYAANGLRTAEQRPNGTRTEYAYNVRNHVTSVLHKAAAGALLLGLSYGVDATGLRNSITETVDGGALSRVTAYDYDANKRLIREEITRAGQTGTQVTSWVYDDVGNRVSQTVDGQALSYTYDANDRLLTESDGTSHVYDNNGNLVRTEKGSATQRYSWDSSGRLSEHTDAAGIRTAYSYDPDRIRVSRTTRLGEADAQRTAYLIDYLQPYAQVLEEAAGPATSSALSHQVAYVHGDDLIAQVRGGVAQHYHYDALGSTRLLSSSDGVVSDRYAYTAYGELDTSGSLIASENAYRYTGEQFDSALGMYYLRARYMDPGRGRFMGMDPFAGYVTDPMSRHRYQYGRTNPVMFVDPSGMVYTPDFGRAVEDEVCEQYGRHFVLTTEFECGQVVFYSPAHYFKPDIFDSKNKTFNEIKPFSPDGIPKGIAQIGLYIGAYAGFPWYFNPNVTWVPDSAFIDGTEVYFINLSGVIFYSDDERVYQNWGVATLGTAAAFYALHATKVKTKLGAPAAARALLSNYVRFGAGARTVSLVSNTQTAILARF